MAAMLEELREKNLINRHCIQGRNWSGGGGGVEYSYIRVLSRLICFEMNLKTTDFKRNSSGRTRYMKYSIKRPQLTS